MPRPPCDRHKNLQMVPFGRTFIDVCPVPSCGRCHDEKGYFEVVEGRLVREQRPAPNRIVEAREKLLMAIRTRAGVQAYLFKG